MAQEGALRGRLRATEDGALAARGTRHPLFEYVQQTPQRPRPGASVRHEVPRVGDQVVRALSRRREVHDAQHRALVEETRFGRDGDPHLLRTGLDQTLDSMAAGADMQVLRREQGRIPMQTIRTPVQPRVVIAGTAAGAVRPSTGYAFVRIQRWAARCAAQLAAGRPPVGHPADPAWRVAVDGLFLKVIDQRPELAPELFMAMAGRVEPETLVRFLSDAGRLRDFARVAAALPKRPFLSEMPSALVGATR